MPAQQNAIKMVINCWGFDRAYHVWMVGVDFCKCGLFIVHWYLEQNIVNVWAL